MRIPAPPVPRSGSPILAAHVAYLISLDSAARPGVGGGMAMIADGVQTPVGDGLMYVTVGAHGSGGAYAWTEAIPTGGTTWATGPRSGSTTVDAAYELNVSTAVPSGVRAEAWRDDSNTLRFRY